MSAETPTVRCSGCGIEDDSGLIEPGMAHVVGEQHCGAFAPLAPSEAGGRDYGVRGFSAWLGTHYGAEARQHILPAALDYLASRPSSGEDSARTLHARLDAYEAVFRWLLGEEGEFPARPERVEGKPYPYYFWRTALRWKLEAARAAEGSANG